MKISKQQLKSLIKECLVEILAEGLGSTLTEATKPRAVQQTQRTVTDPNAVLEARRRAMDAADRARQPSKQSNMPAIVKQIATDPVMASIFADTAATTLVEQNN